MRQRRLTATTKLDDNNLDVIPMIPVPPSSTVVSSSTNDDGTIWNNAKRHHRREEEEDDEDSSRSSHTHRPHPSYLNQTIYLPIRQQQHRQQQNQNQHRKLFHSTNGTFHNLVLLLRFADHTDRILPSQADIERLYNSNDVIPPLFMKDFDNDDDDDDVVPTGSVRLFYEAISYNTFTIQTTVIDWITLSHTEAYYGNSEHGFTKFKDAIIEALNILDNGDGGAHSGPPFDFTKFDLDSNGAIDGFGILHSGYGAEFAGVDCYDTPDTSRIWSHKGGINWSSSPEPNTNTGQTQVVSVNRFYVSSALRGKCQSNIVRIGVIVHELGHYLGLPDLYDETFTGNGLGAYDFMSQSWGWDGLGFPPYPSAWSRVLLGWANVKLIVSDGTYKVEQSATSNIVYKIDTGYPTGEYLLIENRQPVGFDVKMEGQGGIAIYHIDNAIINGQNSRGYPSPGTYWPNNGKHYQVALLPADGNYDLEKGGDNHGDAGDLWHSGSQLKELRSGGSHPNTDSYQGGKVKKTGVRIYGFTHSGKYMSFKVAGLGTSTAVDVGEATESVAISLEQQMMTSKPTTLKPITLKPTTTVPTSLPTNEPTTITFPSSESRVTVKPTPNPTDIPTLSPITSVPTVPPQPLKFSPMPVTMKPITSKPSTMPLSIGAAVAATTSVKDCPYYPGLNFGFAHCLNDCEQPKFMRSNTMFEFRSPIECCFVHYEGRPSCLIDSVLVHESEETEFVGNAPSSLVGGDRTDSTVVLDYPDKHTKSSASDYNSDLHSKSSGLDLSMTEIIITPTDDTTIHSDEAPNLEFSGNDDLLLVGRQDEILLKFDLTPFSTLTGRKEYRAVLRLYALTSSPSGGVVYFTSSNIWDEASVDWSSSPEANFIVGTVGLVRQNTWVEVELTIPLTIDRVTTLRVKPESSNHSWLAKFSSKENSMGYPAPELRIIL
jgi:M6 family metalloprotease-like protein